MSEMQEWLDVLNGQITNEMALRDRTKDEIRQRAWAKGAPSMTLHMDLEHQDALYIVRTYPMRREREYLCEAIATAKEAPPGTLAETFNTAWKAKFDLRT